jgi:hypothetical protein
MLRIALPAALLLATPALAQDVAYEIVNSTGLTVMELYASPTGESWGDDRLGSNIIEAGGTGSVTLADAAAQCAYEIRVILEDGQELTDSVDVCASPSYTLAQ